MRDNLCKGAKVVCEIPEDDSIRLAGLKGKELSEENIAIKKIWEILK